MLTRFLAFRLQYPPQRNTKVSLETCCSFVRSYVRLLRAGSDLAAYCFPRINSATSRQAGRRESASKMAARRTGSRRTGREYRLQTQMHSEQHLSFRQLHSQPLDLVENCTRKHNRKEKDTYQVTKRTRKKSSEIRSYR